MKSRILAPSNKRDFYARLLKGEFGNHPRIWTSLEQLRDSGYDGLVSIRSLIPGGRCLTRVNAREIKSLDENAIIQESMPDECLKIQGSITQDELGEVLLEYSTERDKKFREATFTTVRGRAAELVLRSHVDSKSLKDMYAMLTMYGQNCVIEFASYEKAVGVIPDRHTVTFEVRGY